MLTGIQLAKNPSIFKQPKVLLSYSQQLFFLNKQNISFPRQSLEHRSARSLCPSKFCRRPLNFLCLQQPEMRNLLSETPSAETWDCHPIINTAKQVVHKVLRDYTPLIHDCYFHCGNAWLCVNSLAPLHACATHVVSHTPSVWATSTSSWQNQNRLRRVDVQTLTHFFE